MRVLVACEASGRVRDAFARRGHDAWSADYYECAGQHIQGDVSETLRQPWDLVIAHPPCTYLSNAGVCFLEGNPKRISKVFAAAEFFKLCVNANAPKVCVENPVMHKLAKELVGVSATQYVHPYHFGYPLRKNTGLFLRGLPVLKPTHSKDDYQVVHAVMPNLDDMARWRKIFNHPARSRIRSLTSHAIADAMAQQWG